MNLDFADTARSFDNRLLHLIIMPTEHCNLRCVYCYEDFAIGRMKPHVIQGIKSLIRKRAAKLARLEIGWFGGEPLLGLPVIREICHEACNCMAANPQMEYAASVSTNAVLLTKDCLHELVALGVRTFQISLDGARQIHNRTKVTGSGNGTFERIWRNLLQAKESAADYEIALRIHLTRANLTSIHELLDEIRWSFGGDRRFKVYFKAIEPLGGSNDKPLPLLDRTESEEHIRLLQANFSGTTLVRSEIASPAVCYAAKANSFVIRADGRIGKCTVALNQHENCVGTLTSDGRIRIDDLKFRPWVSGLIAGDAMYAKCPLPSVLQNVIAAK